MEVTVYGTPVCPNCSSVKTFLETKGVGYDYKTIGEDVEKGEVDKTVGRNVRSVPVIVVNGFEKSFAELKDWVAVDYDPSSLVAGLSI